VEFLVASPLARGTIGYQGIGERDVLDVLNDVKRRFPIDEDRVYLTGLSMGGGGALWLGLSRPDLWAAIAAVCPAVPPGTDELAPNALHLPVRLFQGALDPLVSPLATREWHKRLLGLGGEVEYLEYANVRHNSWDRAYANASIFDWFAKVRRNRFPDRVRFATRWYEYRKAYWAEIDGLQPGTAAKLEAGFEGPNRITVDTEGLDGFTLRLAGHPQFRAKSSLRITIDNALQRPASGAELSYRKGYRGWEAGKIVLGESAKRPGAEGPIYAAVSARHVYVYGTLDSPSPEEEERRRKDAEEAADWSLANLHPTLKMRIIADRKVTDADLRGSNAVLFGTRQTNSLIARWADRMPMELNAGAADYGLLQIVHTGERYLLVSSGTPWWVTSDINARSALRFLPRQIRLLQSFGDYIVFRGTVDDIIAEGLFDRNWRLPEKDAETLRATGAVRVR
jgi:hypothetical protein